MNQDKTMKCTKCIWIGIQADAENGVCPDCTGELTLYDKLDKLHQRAERRRLDGVKPTLAQIRKMVQRTKCITPMQSAKVIDAITRAMMPEGVL